VCNALRREYRAPVCQYLLADPVDEVVVNAFFEALSPVEIDLYSRAMAHRKQADEQAQNARHQQLQRLRYQAELARRRFERCDPDNRLVADELERRWEGTLRELRRAEEIEDEIQRQSEVLSEGLSEELKEAFTTLGRKLPRIWEGDLLSRQHKKALLRCLIEKVVVHRLAPDRLQARIVWKGVQSSTFEVRTNVASFADLSGAGEMERLIEELFGEGLSDEEIAHRLTNLGHRSPQSAHVLSSTVSKVRHRLRLLRSCSQSHPPNMAGSLTVSQVAQKLGVSVWWVYDRIRSGRIQIAKDAATGLYLFPDEPATTERLRELKEGKIQEIGF
jgi:hypothetical protein